MNWHIEEAKNEQKTVKLNDIYLYSKYNPQRDVEKFMTAEVDTTNKKFILVGLGLGYHLDYLVEHLENIEVQYILLDEQENELYLENNTKQYLQLPNVHAFKSEEEFNEQAQIIIPQSFLRAIGHNHPLFEFIEDIKIRQVSYKRFKEQMIKNFTENIKRFTPLLKITTSKKAALVASGPSLNNTISWLQKHQKEFDIYCVGSALKVLLAHQIMPTAVFMTDAQHTMLEQIDMRYKGILYFLSTANYQAVSEHPGEKQILFQKGFTCAEKFAEQYEQPLFETGGSVATTTFSYIEWLGYKELYLFGQDLGFSEMQTHARGSTSGKGIKKYNQLLDVVANDHTIIHTTPNLLSYKRWFDQAFSKTSMKIFNTSERGAKLKNTVFFETILKS